MEDWFTRSWDALLGRETGPLHFRLILQPLVASFFAIRSGMRDAREGQTLFFWTVVRNATQRRLLLRQLWTDVGKLFIVAVALDTLYQLVVLRWFYPLQALIVAVLLAIIPYLMFRGLANRVGRWFK
ncbi:hypothetical protein BH10PLA2_BH10PLA2_31080 [soil metagenome]